MSEKLRQPTGVLIARLQRVARFFDQMAKDPAAVVPHTTVEGMRARANTCWQAAARLEELNAQQPIVTLDVARLTSPR